MSLKRKFWGIGDHWASADYGAADDKYDDNDDDDKYDDNGDDDKYDDNDDDDKDKDNDDCALYWNPPCSITFGALYAAPM